MKPLQTSSRTKAQTSLAVRDPRLDVFSQNRAPNLDHGHGYRSFDAPFQFVERFFRSSSSIRRRWTLVPSTTIPRSEGRGGREGGAGPGAGGRGRAGACQAADVESTVDQYEDTEAARANEEGTRGDTDCA